MKPLLPAALLILAACAGPDWQPADMRIATRWANEVSPENAHPEYPRPMKRRAEWENLNGIWDYALVDRDAEPEAYDGKILVRNGTAVASVDSYFGMRERSGFVTLAAGKHVFEVLYFQGGGGVGLDLKFDRPGIGKRSLEPGMLSHSQ